MSLIERLDRETNGLELHDKVDHVIYQSGLIDFFKKDKGEKGETRVENLLELISAGRSFEPDPAADMPALERVTSAAGIALFADAASAFGARIGGRTPSAAFSGFSTT